MNFNHVRNIEDRERIGIAIQALRSLSCRMESVFEPARAALDLLVPVQKRLNEWIDARTDFYEQDKIVERKT